jgi:predicted nucleic acid-binding Zn ribbon protein
MSVESCSVDLPIRTCVVCGKKFYHLRDIQTCCKDCWKILNRRKQKESHHSCKKVNYKDCNGWTEDAYKKIYKYYFTYKITNKINGKYYYGIHMTDNLDDGYMGSGRLINNAIKKYGIENFEKIIISYYECYKDLVEAEHELINETVLSDKNSYNLARGGVGGPNFKGKHHSEETKKKIRENCKLVQERNIVRLKEWYSYYCDNGWNEFLKRYGYKGRFKAFKERMILNGIVTRENFLSIIE